MNKDDPQHNTALLLASIATLLTLLVIALGAFTRLIDAGLGCPDWPGCYGHLFVPQKTPALQFLVSYKAWAEMIHRYCAGTLALLLLIIGLLGCHIARQQPNQKTLWLPSIALLLLLIYQPILGMWTVTFKLMPVIVSQHLLGGFLIFSSLWWYRLQLTKNLTPIILPRHLILGCRLGLLLIFLQIALGAWTSTNYAALSCQDFPFCEAAHWWPSGGLTQAFHFFNTANLSYDGGWLPLAAKQTIQMLHRSGALLVVTYWLVLGMKILQQSSAPQTLRPLFLLLALFVLQIALGIGNVLLQLPVAVAVCHTLCAAFCLITAIHFNAHIRQEPIHEI